MCNILRGFGSERSSSRTFSVFEYVLDWVSNAAQALKTAVRAIWDHAHVGYLVAPVNEVLQFGVQVAGLLLAAGTRLTCRRPRMTPCLVRGRG